MPRNAAGAYTLPNPAVEAGNTIESADANDTRDDLANEITNSLDRSARGGMLAALRLADGSVGVPGLAFVLDTNTGLYRIGADNAALVGGGVAVLSWTGSLLTALAPLVFSADNTHDIGATGATRPRTGYFGMSLVAPTIGPAAAQQHTLPAVASDTVALLAATQTLTNKTLTAPVLGGTLTGTYTIGGTPTFPANIAKLDTADQALTGGVIVTSLSLGTISSGTVTPNPGDRPMQHYTNGGAHTLAPSSNVGSVLVDITNNASAGAITTSGFTFVMGDAFTTTDGDVFRCHISIGNGGSLLQVQALQ